MKIKQRDINQHLFICCNDKKKDKCCGKKGAEDLVKALKKRLKKENLWGEYKVTKSGCLGPCSDGICATMYPDNLLITNLKECDDEKLFNLLVRSAKED